MGIHDQSFDCPPEDGMKCSSTSSINTATDQLKESYPKEGSLGNDCRDCKKDSSKKLLPFPGKRVGENNTSTPSSNGVSSHYPITRAKTQSNAIKTGYIRSPEETMRVWIAPLHTKDGIIDETYAQIVSVEGAWVKAPTSTPLEES